MILGKCERPVRIMIGNGKIIQAIGKNRSTPIRPYAGTLGISRPLVGIFVTFFFFSVVLFCAPSVYAK
jgi:hypothetical protein